MFDFQNYRIHRQTHCGSSVGLNQNGWYPTSRSRQQPQPIQWEFLVVGHLRPTALRIVRFHLHVQAKGSLRVRAKSLVASQASTFAAV